MLLHHIQTAPVPTHVLKPEMKIPETVSALIMKALEKDPAHRFQTGEQMAQALSDYNAAAGAGLLDAPERTPAGGTIGAFNTAAMAAASGSQPAPPTPRATVRATVPATVPVDGETRVLGSFTLPMPASPPTQDPQVTAPAAKVPVTSASPKKSRRWLVWSAAGAAVLVVLVWGAWQLGSRSSAAQQTNDQPATDTAEPETPTVDTKQSRRSHTGHKSGSQSNSNDSASRENSAANQKAQAQQLVSQGNRQLANRDFSGAQSSFQRALALDPGNSAAQNGLKAAQAGALAQGIGSIFRH
jgi:serine/threonine-protein kinase